MYEIIPKDQPKEEEKKTEDDEEDLRFEPGEWRPSMNLFELVQCIPKFVASTIEKKAPSGDAPAPMLGRFYLGLNYDYQQVWMHNQNSSQTANKEDRETRVVIYPCSQEKQIMTKNQQGQKVHKGAIIDAYIVVSESVFLVLEPEAKMKGIGKLVSWGTLPTIDNIKRNLDNPDFLTIAWRKVDYKEPWVLQVLLPNNANDCVNFIQAQLKKQGLYIDKKYEKKRKLQESEVSAESVMKQQDQVEKLLKMIYQYETVIEQAQQTASVAQGEEAKDSSRSEITPTTV